MGSEVGLSDPLTVNIHREGRIGPPIHPTAATTGNGYGSRNTTSLSRHGGRDVGPRWKPSVFDFKTVRSGSTCPTCKGSGRIPKGEFSC